MDAVQQEFEVTLPVGVVDQEGRRHQRGAIRRMRGHEEALLYDGHLSAGQLVSELIRACLLRLGDRGALDAEAVAELYTADRNYLMLQLRRITLGDTLVASYRCPRCGTDLVAQEDLSTLEVRRYDGDAAPPPTLSVTLEEGYVDREGKRHTEVVLTMPRGVDEERICRMVPADPLAAQDALLLRCIERFGELPASAMEAYGVKVLRELTMGDRLSLQRALSSGFPGVRFARQMQCGPCGSAFEGVLDVASFFGQG